MYYSPEIVNKFRRINIEQFYNTSTIPKSPNGGQGDTSQRSRQRMKSASNRTFSAQLPSYSSQRKDSKQEMGDFFKQVWRDQSAQPIQGQQDNKPKRKFKKKKINVNQKKAAEFSDNLRKQHLNITKSESFYKIGGGDSSSQNKNKKKYLYQSYEQSPVWGQSSATLRQTSQSFHFPKDERFREKRLQSTDKLALQIQIPSTLNRKSCSLGKGIKQYVHLYELKRNVENPPPGKYDISTTLDDVLNISLGTQDKFFQIDTTKKYPGPGTYETREIPGKEKKAFSLRGQLKRFYEVNLQKDIPSSDKYYPQPNNVVSPSRYENITFGKGNKTDFATYNGVPGPGQYPCHSSFEKLTTNNRTYQILRQARFGKNRQKSILKEVLMDVTNTDSQKNQTVSTAAFYTTEQNFHQQEIDQFSADKSYFLKGMAKDALDTCQQIQ